MKHKLLSPGLFFAVPLLGSCLVTVVTFQLPPEYYIGVAILLCIGLSCLLFESLQSTELPSKSVRLGSKGTNDVENKIALLLGGVVTLACVVDVVFFPLPLLNPSIYANFEGGRSAVRHVSNMCWVLPAIGMLCTRSNIIKFILIVIGVVFPVLVLDRNRLFASIFCFAFIMILYSERKLPWKSIFLAVIVAFVAFAQLGKLRSGNLTWIDLPFSDIYANSSPGVKWVLLYISAGVYNFSSILAKGYTNPDFLINQIVPGAGGVETLGTSIPFDSPVINVGTEYFPFLMALGVGGAVLAAMVLYIGLILSVQFYRTYPSIFPLLIFIRMSYVCLMAGFAPQAYTWTNFGFIIFCIGLLAVSSSIRPYVDHENV